MRRFALPLMLIALLGTGLAAAQTNAPSEADALRLAKQEAAQATARSQRLEREASRSTSEAARARAEGEALAARIEAAEADITAAETRSRIIEALRVQQRARLAERQGPVVRLTAALQTMARRPPALALIKPGSVEEVVHVRSLLASTLPVIRARTAGLRAEVEQADRLGRQAQLARGALLSSQGQLRERRVALARFEANQRLRSQSLIQTAMSESDRALAFGEEARELTRLLGTREFQQRLGASLAGLPGPALRPGTPRPAAPKAGDAPYLLPVQGKLLTGVGEISDAGVHARGLTFSTAPGAQVVAPGTGRVAYASRFGNYGQVVIIDHGRGWTSVITDLASIEVRTGQTIGRGALVGRAGPGQPRISVELRRGGRPMPIASLVAG